MQREYSKYIIYKSRSFCGEYEAGIIFPNTEKHKDMAEKLDLRKDEIISAGFICFYKDENENIKIKAFGKSTSLNKESREIDSDILNNQLVIER